MLNQSPSMLNQSPDYRKNPNNQIAFWFMFRSLTIHARETVLICGNHEQSTIQCTFE
jgi:hypothetical protein